MGGVLDGIRVVDFSWGVAGPLTTMLLADHGAEVISIAPPGGPPFGEPQGSRVWNRGKLSGEFDLHHEEDRQLVNRLAVQADVVVESWAPGVAERLGLGYEELRKHNPRLIYGSITGYGRGMSDSQRPAYDQLVAARTGFQQEVRGYYGSPMDHILGRDADGADVTVPPELLIGSNRDGPIFSATPSPSMAAAYLATIGISAALHARERSGHGQRVETSLLQGLLQYSGCTWQRPQRPDAPGYDMQVVERRQTWGIVPVADGWMCMWTSPTSWPILAAQGDQLVVPDPEAVRARDAKRGSNVSIEARLESLREAAPYLRRFTVAEWTATAYEAGFGLHPIRTPEEALGDPGSLDDGSVVEIVDPELGALRQAGIVYRLHSRPTQPRGPAPRRGQHTDEIRTMATRASLDGVGADVDVSVSPPHEAAAPTRGPLHGIRVLDFGLAVAGPWTSQVLADLGADVIKIDSQERAGWCYTHMGMGVNKSKRHLVLDVKDPHSRPVLEDLLRSADVVTLNMRPEAMQRIGLDYASVRRVNPRIVHLHTRAFEAGPRSDMGGHDQAGNALGGTMWEDGGCWDGGRPYFHVGTGGDLGNGFLGAIAVIQALYDRERTGQGQQVDTSILNAALLVNSRVYTTPAGQIFERPTTDADQLGFNALYRLYECSEGWLCLAVLSERDWTALQRAIPPLAADPRFERQADRHHADAALAEILADVFSQDSARQWFDVLDAAGVPCEIVDSTYPQRLFDDPELLERGWVTHAEGHPTVGSIDMFGTGIEFSRTPFRAPAGPPPVPGQHSAEVLAELGYDEAAIRSLAESGTVAIAKDPART